MKCRLNFEREFQPDARTSVTRPDGVEMTIGVLAMAPAGSIVSGPDCWWLVGMHHSFFRPLRGGKTEHVVLDGLGGQRLAFVAEPADQECLDRCLVEGKVNPGTTLKPQPMPPPAPEPVAAVPPEPVAAVQPDAESQE